ncbi:MAG: DUF4202 family protein [Candidatus Doudnabacteria bacterium]|nr:DUF4202 family protein [Candidatus Doudnabacteria bacterium]
MKYFELVKKFVDDSFTKAEVASDLKHFERTVYWLKQFKPDADEAFVIAAYAHDMERAFRDKTTDIFEGKNYTDAYFTEEHPRKGAEIIAEFLSKNGASHEMIEKVKSLIANHELGGDPDQNLLKDVDSVSFFENQIPHFIRIAQKKPDRADKIRKKFDWMFERITSAKAKEIARPMYQAAIKQLEQI